MKIGLTLPRYRDIVQRTLMKEANDCAVLAIVFATGCKYEEAHNAMQQAGRKNGTSAYGSQLPKALRLLGWKSLWRVPKKSRRVTVARLLLEFGMNTRSIVLVKDHALALVENSVRDSVGRSPRTEVIAVLDLRPVGAVTLGCKD